jgi:hypothetical protein
LTVERLLEEVLEEVAVHPLEQERVHPGRVLHEWS